MNKWAKTNYTIAVIFSLLVLISSLAGIFFLDMNDDIGADSVSYGVLDLSGEKDLGLVDLDGAWEFYPGVFLTQPEDFPETPEYFRVPGNIAVLPSAKTDDGFGGTYRLTIRVPQEGDYGIKTGTIRSAARVILNGRESFTIGNPSLSEADHKHGSRYGLAFVKSEDKNIEIIIHTSGYNFKEAGILKSIVFGSYPKILSLDRSKRIIDGAVIVICMVIAIHSILSWMTRRNEKFLLYAGLTSLLLGIYFSTLQEQMMTSFFNYDFYVRTKIQILAMLMISFFFMKFVQLYYREVNIRKIVNVLSVALLASTLLTLILNPYHWHSTTGFIHAVLIAILFATLVFSTAVVFYMAWQQKEEGYGLILGTVLLTFELVILFKMLFELDLAQIPAVLIVVFNFAISLLMNSRLQQDKIRAESLSKDLVIKDKMKDDFLTRTSHELRVPLHTIVNLSSLMLEGEKGPLNIDQQENMFFISMEGKRLSRLVDDLMDASAMGIDKLSFNKQKVFPGEIAKSMSMEYSFSYKEGKGIEIINEIPEDFRALYVDPDRFRQILTNLLDNAYKFMEKGTIKISAEALENMGKISVVDTGPGIEPEHLSKIFDSFYRSGKKEEMGLGLGLAIVKQMVEGHGGKVWVESTPGLGSAFHFTLPFYVDAIQDKEAVSVRLAPPTESSDSEANILIVDNEPSHVRVLVELLKSEGYNIFIEGHGENVLKVINSADIHLAIIDVMLPDVSGDTVCRKIREDFSMAELPIIMITASGRGRDLNRAFECGANDFIKKPSDPVELRSRVRSLLLMRASYQAGLEKEFNYFYSQLSPHFLYNTLNTIMGLSYSDIDGARKALGNLGTYLRMKMDSQKTGELVDLESEIELVTAYLEIETIRYGERLAIEILGNIKSNYKIPPLTLQPLVENSVRYGINHRERLEIKLDVQEAEDGVYITVADNGPGISDEDKQKLLKGEGKGLGLTNVIRRINLQRKSSITIEDGPQGGTVITIKLAKGL